MRKFQVVQWLAVAALCASGAVARKDEVAMAKCTRVPDECKEDPCDKKDDCEKPCPPQGWGKAKKQTEKRGAARKVVEGKTSAETEIKSAARKAVESEIR